MRSSHTAGRAFAAGSFAAALVAGAVLTAPAALADPIGEGSVPLTLEVESTGSLSMTVDTGAPVLLSEVPVGLEPVSVRARTNGEAWVVNELSDSVVRR